MPLSDTLILSFLRMPGSIARLPSLVLVECFLTLSVKERSKVPIQFLGALLLEPELSWLTTLILQVGGPAFDLRRATSRTRPLLYFHRTVQKRSCYAK